jgi:hypothetical protein
MTIPLTAVRNHECTKSYGTVPVKYRLLQTVRSRTKNVLLLRYNKWLQGHVRRDYRTAHAVKFTTRINIKIHLVVWTLAHETAICHNTRNSSKWNSRVGSQLGYKHAFCQNAVSTKNCLSQYFRTNVARLSVVLLTIGSFVPPVGLCSGGLRQISVSWAICYTMLHVTTF